MALDAALDGARRLWQRPADRRRFVAEVGVSIEVTTLRVLRAVERTDEDEPCVGDIAEQLMIDASTASRMVEQAVSAGFAARSRSSVDRRRAVLSLTEEGIRVLARATEVRQARIRSATEHWSANDIERLTELLERLSRAVEGHGTDD